MDITLPCGGFGSLVMLEAVGKYVGGKVLSAILVVSSAGAVIWFWKHPEQLETIWLTLKYVVAWLGFVAILPWAGFFLTSWIVAKESNAAAAAMLAGFTLADAVVAFCLIGGIRGIGTLSWVVLVLGFLAAGVYNLKVCEYQAERLENT